MRVEGKEPMGVPVTLSSPRDVQRVCESAGLLEVRTNCWSDDLHVDVMTGPAFRDGQCIVMCRSALWSVDIRGGTPAVILSHTIEVARRA